MPSFLDVPMALYRILGDSSAGNHEAFWHGNAGEHFVDHVGFGLKLLEVGDPDIQNTVTRHHADKAQGDLISSVTTRARRRFGI